MAIIKKAVRPFHLQGDFIDVPKPRKKAVFGITGPEKQGKSHFAMSAPDPMVIFDLDIGLEGVANKFSEAGKVIKVCQIDVPDSIGKGQNEALKRIASKQIEKFKKNYAAALASSEVRTIIIDNATSLWDLMLLSHFGKTIQIPQHMRTLPNLEMQEIVRRPLADRSSMVNVIHILQAKKQYVGDSWNGKWEPAGYNKMGFLVQAMLLAERDKDGDFWVKVMDSRRRPDLNGEKWRVGSPKKDNDLDCGPFSPFQWVASELIEESEPDDWE